MKARPILFNTPMVQALLAGRKTQTRRIVKPQSAILTDKMARAFGIRPPIVENTSVVICPYGKVGDLLWVRESFWHARSYPMTLPSGESESGNSWAYRLIHYSADGKPKNTPNSHYPNALSNGAISAPDPYTDWLQRPSIHMPRWASRLTLEITNVRVERLQDISEADKQAEGATANMPFGTVWKKINTTEGIRWEDNPWVWVIEFKVHQKNVDALLAERAAA